MICRCVYDNGSDHKRRLRCFELFCRLHAKPYCAGLHALLDSTPASDVDLGNRSYSTGIYRRTISSSGIKIYARGNTNYFLLLQYWRLTYTTGTTITLVDVLFVTVRPEVIFGACGRKRRREILFRKERKSWKKGQERKVKRKKS